MSNKYGLLEECRDTSLIEQVKMFLSAPDKPNKFIIKDCFTSASLHGIARASPNQCTF